MTKHDLRSADSRTLRTTGIGPSRSDRTLRAVCGALLACAALPALQAAGNDSGTATAKPTATAADSDTAAPLRLTAAELAREIDRHVQRGLDERGIPAAPRTDDSEFVRRVSVDVAGTIPTLARVESFLADPSSDKRARLVDELLGSPEYVRHMTDQWREHLIPSTAAAARRRHETGLLWLEEAFRMNRPYDEFVRGILTADGMQRENGATTFLLTHQSLDEVTDRLSRILLGVQVTCAQCHDHPFADWKQADYWGMAAFFSKVRHQYQRTDGVEQYGVSERGDRKPLMTPPSFKEVPPTFLGGPRPTLDPNEPYLPVFVDWLASAENPWFARAFANRLWWKFHGRGLVEPVDDLREANPGTHPELLALLGEQFRLSGFDIHYLIRAVVLSGTYQRTSRPTGEPRADDTAWFGRMPVRILAPYALGDSIRTVMALGDDPPAAPATPPAPAPELSYEEQLKASQRARFGRDSFASFFKGEDGAPPTAYETGVPQALRLMNAQEMQRGSRVVTALSRTHKETGDLVDRMFLASLARRPTDDEREIALKYVASRPERSRALNDVLWALLNGAEFATNH